MHSWCCDPLEKSVNVQTLIAKPLFVNSAIHIESCRCLVLPLPISHKKSRRRYLQGLTVTTRAYQSSHRAFAASSWQCSRCRPLRLQNHQVKQHDRVGRMADTLEFSNVALPRDRFDPALIAKLKALAGSVILEAGNEISLKHRYIERRMEPLNLYLDRVDAERNDAAIAGYGNAIRKLAAANISPGDRLCKNFGVTHYDRVVFYDYDEIECLTDCNFRDIPPAPSFEAEMGSEPWYSVGRIDVFPASYSKPISGDSGNSIRHIIPRQAGQQLFFLSPILIGLNPDFRRSRQ